MAGITNQSGTLAEAYAYDVYGKITSSLSNIGNPYYFTGRHYDSDTGLYHYRARVYSPEIGRFLQTDPLGYVDSLNLYSYVLNNPVNAIDPYGLRTLGYDFSLTAGAGGGVTGGYTWVIDSKGNVAKIKHSGAGGFGGIAAGGAVQIQITNTPTINELSGMNVSVGGSIGPKIVEVTGEWIIMPGGYQGANFGVGFSVGPSPVEMHTMIESSDIVWQGNLLDMAAEWIGGVSDKIFKNDPCK